MVFLRHRLENCAVGQIPTTRRLRRRKTRAFHSRSFRKARLGPCVAPSAATSPANAPGTCPDTRRVAQSVIAPSKIGKDGGQASTTAAVRIAVRPRTVRKAPHHFHLQTQRKERRATLWSPAPNLGRTLSLTGILLYTLWAEPLPCRNAHHQPVTSPPKLVLVPIRPTQSGSCF